MDRPLATRLVRIAPIACGLALIAATISVAAAAGAIHGPPSPVASASVTSHGGCRRVPAPKPRIEHLHRPPQIVHRRDRLTARVKTNCGVFRIRLDTRRFPETVNSFVFLARSGFYDGGSLRGRQREKSRRPASRRCRSAPSRRFRWRRDGPPSVLLGPDEAGPGCPRAARPPSSGRAPSRVLLRKPIPRLGGRPAWLRAQAI